MTTSNPKRKILIADDSSSALFLYCQVLKNLDAEIDTVSNGRDALQRALQTPYDVIITDVHMPYMDGIELCRALQKDEVTHTIPIIIVSDFDSDTDVERGFEVGAFAYLGKKEVANALFKTVSDCIWKYDNVRQKHILVVEDSESIKQFIEKGLKERSFKVTTACDGLRAKEMITELKPDLILSDLQMPNLDGLGLCKWLKSIPAVAHIPLVAMSSGNEQYAIERIIQYGAAAYLQKPFTTSQLIVLLDRILSDHFNILMKERERLSIEQIALVNSISSLVTALEARDIYTKGHSESVSLLVAGMAALLGTQKDDIELITVGGRLHDIGKIGIRDSVLLKPDRLSEQEFEHIKQHPVIGRKILEPIPSLIRILPITYSHHERWDGTGYPEKIGGKEIPLWARMTSVADTYDALTSDRPYRKGLPNEKAFEIIRGIRGTQLCPDCVDLFFNYVDSPAFVNHFGMSREP